MNSGYVYQLVCAKTRKPFYVGSTIGDVRKRLQLHISCIKNGNKSPVCEYCRKNKIQPDIVILQEFPKISSKNLRQVERAWVIAFKVAGINIQNFAYNRSNIEKEIKTIFKGYKPKYPPVKSSSAKTMPLIYQATKIHPIFLAFLRLDVKNGLFPSINNGINVALFHYFKDQMSDEQIKEVKKSILV